MTFPLKTRCRVYLNTAMAASAAPIAAEIYLDGVENVYTPVTGDRLIITALRMHTDTNGVWQAFLDDSPVGNGWNSTDNVIRIFTTVDAGTGSHHEHLNTLPGEEFRPHEWRDGGSNTYDPLTAPDPWRLWVLGPNNANFTVMGEGYIINKQ